MPGLVSLAALSADVTATMPLNTPAVSTATTGTLPVGATHRLDATSGALARTLPSAVSAGAGGIVVVKKTDATSNAVTVTASGSDTINVSGSTRTLTLPREAAHFRSDGVSDWTVVASDTPVTQLDSRYDARYVTPATATGTYASALFTPATSSTLRKGLARVRAGTGDCKILCVGDSTTAGVGVTSAPNGAGSPLSYPYQLAAILNASLIPAARGLGIPPSNILSGNPDTRWTAGAGWAPTNNFAWATGADYKWTSSGSPASLVYTDPVLADTYDVYYLKNTGLGTFTATATGGSGSVVNTSATTGIGKATITAGSAATTNTVTIVPSASLGDVHIVGIEPSLSTTSKVRVGNAGVGSSRAVTHWNGNGSGAGWNSQACIKAYAPDLTIISLGINDAINAASASAYTAAIQPLITAAQVSGDVLILPPIPSTSSAAAGVLTNEASYAAALQGLGYRYGDLIARWSSGDAINTLGFMSGDAYHPNALGYADLAQWLAAGIRAV